MSNVVELLLIFFIVAMIPVVVALGLLLIRTMNKNSQLRQDMIKKELEYQDQRDAIAGIVIFMIFALPFFLLLILSTYIG